MNKTTFQQWYRPKAKVFLRKLHLRTRVRIFAPLKARVSRGFPPENFEVLECLELGLHFVSFVKSYAANQTTMLLVI